MEIIKGAGVWTHPGEAGNDWIEQLRTSDLSVGTYCIPVGGRDAQSPLVETFRDGVSDSASSQVTTVVARRVGLIGVEGWELDQLWAGVEPDVLLYAAL